MLSKMYADEVVSGPLKSTATSSSSKSQQQQELIVNTRPVVVDNSILDRTIEMISKGGLSVQNEDKLIDLTLNMNPKLFSLAKHYSDRPNRFLDHAVRNIDRMMMTDVVC